MNKKPTAWELFFECFKEDEEVVVIDDDENLWFGKLKLHKGSLREDSFSLIDIRGQAKVFTWYEVSFMAHDGFPVRKLTGADGSRTIESMDTTDITKAIRELATKTLCDICNKLKEAKSMRTSTARRNIHNEHRHVNYCEECGDKISEFGSNSPEYRFLFSDPYFIENVRATLFNPGNSTPEFWGCHDYEEVLILTARDGAKAQLFSIPNVYYFDG